jgi:hypothetical protein
MNSELEKIKEWCDVNKLSINMFKTNFMIIKSPKKKDMSVDIHIKTKDGSCHSLDLKDHIKYLGVMIDASLSWKYQVSYICSRISRNIGILSKLRARLLSVESTTLNQQPVKQSGNKRCEHILLKSCWNSIATSLLQVCYNLCVLTYVVVSSPVI